MASIKCCGSSAQETSSPRKAPRTAIIFPARSKKVTLGVVTGCTDSPTFGKSRPYHNTTASATTATTAAKRTIITIAVMNNERLGGEGGANGEESKGEG